LVFDPGHPALVLVVVVLFQPLGVGLLFLLLGGEVVVFLLCLLLRGLGFAADVLGEIHAFGVSSNWKMQMMYERIDFGMELESKLLQTFEQKRLEERGIILTCEPTCGGAWS
jgi:hypothetical protein